MLAPRSWLVVPADNEAKLARVPELGAGAIVLDFAGVAEADKADARDKAAQYLARQRPQLAGKGHSARWLRINPIGSPHWKEDLVAALPHQPDGVVLPRAAGAQQVQLLASEIYELEQKTGCEHNSVRILAQVGDTAEAAIAMAEFAKDPHPRVLGLSWDAQALASSAQLGRGENEITRHVRAQLVLTAKARGLVAIESASGLVKQREALEAAVGRARANGFDGMMARHPAQVAVIEQVFAPSEEERELARRIVVAFADEPEAHLLTVEGRPVDRAQLARARAIAESD